MNSLMIKNISKKYDNVFALNNLSLTLHEGTYGLLGPNGAGKTTLIRILTSLLKPDSGEISFGQVKWSNSADVRRLIGYLPQKFSLYKNIKVHEALLHIASMKGIKNNKDKLVKDVIEKVHLEEHSNKKIGKLSGGMVRRVGIAQAILGNPQIIVVDEPTAGLDPEERIRFRNLLSQLSQNSIIIISSHIVEDIETICDRAAILHHGELLAEGTIQSLADHARDYVWETTVSKEEYKNLSDKLTIISSHFIDDKYTIRILSKEAINSDCVKKTPSLEDGYLYMMKGV